MAFTLIELLVVIAIIALLVSILLPSLNRAKDMARQVVCSTNMRGIGSTAALFAEEHDGKLPAISGHNVVHGWETENPNGYDGMVELQLYAQGKGDIGNVSPWSPSTSAAQKQPEYICPVDAFPTHTVENGDMRAVSYAPNQYAWANTSSRLHSDDANFGSDARACTARTATCSTR